MILDNKLTNDTSKLIAFQNLGEEMNKNLDKDANVNVCFGPSQIVNLPYTCKPRYGSTKNWNWTFLFAGSFAAKTRSGENKE